MANMIEVQHLTKDYGNNRGIFDVSFEIHEGRVVGFLGPNGAGKTTTIRHLLGFIISHQGRAYINQMDCFIKQPEIQKMVGYLPGEINFIDDFDGNQFIKFIAKMKKMTDLNYAEELIKTFELDVKMPIKKMSKGMKQKLGIVVAFMDKPKVLLLDEPSSGLDPLMQNKLIDLILEHKKTGTTIFLSSHMFEEVEKTCDRVIMIKNGRIVADHSIEALKKTRKKTYIITFSNTDEAHRFAVENNIFAVNNETVKYDLIGDVNNFIAKLNNFDIKSLDVPVQSLEEIFMQYYGE